jgi:DNA polymerase III subunit delta
MVITLTGENGFALGQELKKLVNSFVAENSDMAIERLDGDEAEFVRIQEALTSLPFLVNKKMVVLRSPSANKKFTEEAERLLGDVPETTDVLLVEPKLDKRLSYYKYLKKATDFREFPQLDTNGLAQWLSKTAKGQKGSLGLSDARYLVERVGTNQQLLANELEKLLIHDPTVTRHAIDELTEQAPQSTIFQLLDAAFAGNSKRALELYNEQRALKVETPQIVAMLAWQLHVLAIIKTAGQKGPNDIAREAKLSPFVVQKSSNIAGKLSLGELKKLIADLLNIDVRSKRESIDPDEALQHYLLSLST